MGSNAIAILATIAVFLSCASGGAYDWMKYDHFDELIDKMEAVNEENCESKNREELFLPKDSISQIVLTNHLRASQYESNYYRNRSTLLQLHSTVLTNAYKYSYLFQRKNESWNFEEQPSLFYYYLGLTADVTANNGLINASAIMFGGDMFYPNFLENVAFNDTLPLFGPRAWRIDDYNDPSNWLREPTNNTFRVTDYGAGPFRNYNLTAYKINEWYNLWYNHRKVNMKADYCCEGTYDPVEVELNQGFKSSFFGPLIPRIDSANDEQAVLFTSPYFDCGRSNKWVVSAVSPVFDRQKRYMYDTDSSNSSAVHEHLKRTVIAGVAVADVDFLEVDFNPCPQVKTAEGEPVDGNNYLNGTARCHVKSTICKPLPGFGFQRGGYICECRPRYRYPEYIQGPYLGVAIERATKDEYEKGFQCLEIGDQYEIPTKNAEEADNGGRDRISGSTGKRKRRDAEKAFRNDMIEKISRYDNSQKRFLRKVIPRKFNSEREIRSEYMKRVADYKDIPDHVYETFGHITDLQHTEKAKARKIVSKIALGPDEKEVAHNRTKRNAFNLLNFNRVQSIFAYKAGIKDTNCLDYSEEDLQLPGDVKYGVEWKLERFGRIALRLADFLSSFLQNVDGKQDYDLPLRYGILRGDREFVEDQLIAEVLAVILAEPHVEGIGIYYDTDQFVDRKMGRKQRFAPYAYTKVADSKDSYHYTDRATDKVDYTSSTWFEQIKKRWAYSQRGLEKYVLNPWIRSDSSGNNLRKHEDYPLLWEAARYEHGVWSDPYFDCKGYLKDWIISYRVPFFGNTGYGTPTEFRGMVAIDLNLDLLDIDQCPSDFFVSNAFMASAKCDYRTTSCMPIPNRGFRENIGYRCDCKQGYEYPWLGNEYFYTGDLIENERQRVVDGLLSRIGRLECRMSGGSVPTISYLLMVSLITLSFVYHI